MKHNQQLIEIINQLQAKEASNKSQAVKLESKTNSVRNIIEEIPETNDVLKSYLKKFKNFKSEIENDIQSKDTNELDVLLDNVATEVCGDFDRYSSKDSRVFRNKAKKTDSKITTMRWTQYSNSRANLTTDKKMAPLRLDKYSS
jgi:Zn-dependent oligopeptidase